MLHARREDQRQRDRRPTAASTATTRARRCCATSRPRASVEKAVPHKHAVPRLRAHRPGRRADAHRPVVRRDDQAAAPTGKTIAGKAIDAVASGAVRFVRAQWINTYNQWMKNIQDWCISRQLWWGHQIPAWYGERRRDLRRPQRGRGARQGRGRGLCRRADARRRRARHLVLVGAGAVLVARLAEDRPRSSSSSCLRRVLVTGYDIIFFWVARMIMMTTALHRQGAVPRRLHPRPGARRAAARG